MGGRHSKRHPINWGRKLKGNATGHAAIQFGRSSYLGPNIQPWEGRSFVRCQCGTLCSGKGDEGGINSHARHIIRRRTGR